MAGMSVLYLGLAILVGALSGVHVPINGALGAHVGSALLATLVFYGIAFVLIAATNIVVWPGRSIAALSTVPPWYYLAGVISVVVVGGSTFLIPRIGAVNLFALMLSTQMVVRMVISHFGWLSSPVDPVTLSKVLGGIMLVAGTILVVRH